MDKPYDPQQATGDAWRALLAEGGPILADGAMGTSLFAMGLEFGDPPELWNLAHPELVRRVHRGYLDAGARILLTNTSGGNRLRLGLHGLESRVAEFNRTAAILLRSEVEASGGGALVAGDIGPSGEIMAPLGTLDPERARDAFAEQARSLIEGGADLIWIETMSDLAEVRAAIEGVRSVAPRIPVIATMSFDTRGHTMMGVKPARAATELLAAGADAVGGNCGNGPDELVPVMQQMREAAPDAVLVAKANAGIPQVTGLTAEYTMTPDDMASCAVDLVASGARIVGGCCGNGAAHVAAIGLAVGAHPTG
jgi:5-methyltetrahydrofolate--homocysteine methyltransferase